MSCSHSISPTLRSPRMYAISPPVPWSTWCPRQRHGSTSASPRVHLGIVSGRHSRQTALQECARKLKSRLSVHAVTRCCVRATPWPPARFGGRAQSIPLLFPCSAANLLLFAGLNFRCSALHVESVDNDILADKRHRLRRSGRRHGALGYEIQQASIKRDFIAAVILLEGRAAVVRTELQ